MVNTRPVTNQLYHNYLQKAEECLDSARDAFNKSNWNSSVISSIHCGISAGDALTVFFLGKRCAGERHTDVLLLIKEIDNLSDLDLLKKLNQLSSLLNIKNQAEYEEKLMYLPQAESALKYAERFLSWVKNKTSI